MKKTLLVLCSLICCACFFAKAQTAYTIISSAGDGGMIARSGNIRVEKGASQEFIITPVAGNKINSIKVDGAEVEWSTKYLSNSTVGSYTFTNVRANHTIYASFAAATQFNIRAIAPDNGHITPVGDTKVNKGGNSPVYTITANDGYVIENFLIDNMKNRLLNATARLSYTFSRVSSDHIIKATFVSKDSSIYTLKATATAGGRVSPAIIKAKVDDEVTFNVVPDSGFVIASVTDSRPQNWRLGTNTYTVSHIMGDHNLQVLFDSAIHTVTTSVGAGGTVSPASAKVAFAGTSPVFTVKADSGYVIEQILLDKSAVYIPGPPSTTFSTTFDRVYFTRSLVASFVPSDASYGITASSSSGGTITPTGTSKVTIGKSLTYSINAKAGYAIKDVTVDGKLISTFFDPKLNSYNYLFNDVRSNHTISATFVSLANRFTVVTLPGPHGSITPLGINRVKYGDSLGIDVKAKPGYRIQDILLDGNSLFSFPTTPETNFHYRLSSVIADHSVIPIFSPLKSTTFQIRTSTTPQVGYVYGPALVDSGSIQFYRIIPRTDFKVALNRLMVDGYPEDPTDTYFFINVKTAHTLQADFGGKPDCDLLDLYDVPRKTALPSIAKTFQHIYVLAGGGRQNDLGKLSIEWDNTSKRLSQLLITPASGNESVDLSKATQNFAGKNPSITIANTNISPMIVVYLNSIDNAYYANMIGNDFVLVSKSGLYALYCTNSELSPTLCASNIFTTNERMEQTVNQATVTRPTEVNARLLTAYPNPFSRTATIHYVLPEHGPVSVYISDLSGKRIAVLVNQVQEPGEHTLKVNGSLLATGSYLYTIESRGFRETKQLIHIKE